MIMGTGKIHYPLLIATIVLAALLALAAMLRIRVDTDVVASLPKSDGVLSDAVHIFRHHPIQNQIAIDIALPLTDKDMLVQIAGEVERHLSESGLFTRVGVDDLQQAFPQLVGWTADNLPYLFSAEELKDQIVPLLSSQAVENTFDQLRQNLIGFNSIGQTGLIMQDPLGFRGLKLRQLSALVPSPNAQIYKGRLVSSDGRHLMVLAQPIGSGTDTAFARRLNDLMQKVQVDLSHAFKPTPDRHVTLTPVGAYRASLDNETLVRRDANKAILLATLGISVLLILAFPRPLLGLLALLPALVGTVVAFFIYSLVHDSISIMALGFGGAIISITVDHGIAYLLFLDRPEKVYGKEASKEVWAVGLLAALTSVGAFVVLMFSGFPIFEELGLFTALGIACSFLFVHTVFPRIFPCMPPADLHRKLPLQNWADRLADLGGKGAVAALMIGVFLFFWAKPRFNVDLSAMNSVSPETRSAESLFSSVWGDIFNKIYIMTEADSLMALKEKNDRLLEELERAHATGKIGSYFVPSDLIPGPSRLKSNASAWHAFWTPRRVADLHSKMKAAALRRGFNMQAFEPFFQTLSSPARPIKEITDNRLLELAGISRSTKDGVWRQITGVTPGARYDADGFYSQFTSMAKIFDPQLFSEKMGRLLFDTFSRMLVIIGVSVFFLLLIFFADLALTLVSLLPLCFALICTVGTLRLMGRSLDIPSLMLAIIVLGMGIDYSLFFVRAYQRYQTNTDPKFSLIRMSVFMASVSTLIGFGVLLTARHSILQSAGLTSFLGIGYAMMGAFLILPPILNRRFGIRPVRPGSHSDDRRDANVRYRNMEPYPRFFARFKLKLDPMFREMETFLPPSQDTFGTILDIGSGYGVPGCWLLQRYPEARIFGIEPDPERVRIANVALGAEGRVAVGLAPELPEAPAPADAAFMLDMCHYLDDAEFGLTLKRLHQRMTKGGMLYIRVVMIPQRALRWGWWLENSRIKLRGARSFYRSLEAVTKLVTNNRFTVMKTQFSGTRKDLVWVIASPQF